MGSPSKPVPQPWSATISSTHDNRIVHSSPPGANWTYDAAGDVTYDGYNNYLYDGAGRLCAVENLQSGPPYAMIDYLYDGNGNRVAKGSLTSFSCNLSTNGFAETNSYVVDKDGEQLTELGGSDPHTNVFAGGKLLATYSNSQVYFGFTDWLGTKRAEIASNCTSTYASLPYGDELTPSGNCPDATEHHYTDKEHDQESGNDFFLARYYNGMAGRFISPDWSGKTEAVPYANFEDPQSLNLYAYVGNEPLTGVDANGHLCGQEYNSTHACSGASLSQLFRADLAAEGTGRPITIGAWLDSDVSDPQQPNSSGGTGFWGRLGHHLGNLFHGHSWNYMKASVTATQIDKFAIVGANNPTITAVTDTSSVVAAVAKLPMVGPVSTGLSILNNPSPTNIGIGAVGLLDAPSAAVTGVFIDLFDYGIHNSNPGFKKVGDPTAPLELHQELPTQDDGCMASGLDSTC